MTRAYIVRQKFWFGMSYAVIDRRLYGSQRQWLRAIARAGKAALIDLPRLLISALRRNLDGQLLARCALAKHAGYLRATLLGVPLVREGLS